LDELTALNDGYDHYDEIVSILKKLKDYTVYHFGFEEKLLEKYNYDQLEAQCFEHHFFVKKLEKICRKDIDEKQQEAVREIYSFVIDWISSHILESDMKYKYCLNSKGAY
jgi:hemerythrin